MTKTFAPDANRPGGKYGHVNPKGPGYTPPDIAGVLKAAFDDVRMEPPRAKAVKPTMALF
jgi:hypothetical protein